MVQKSARRGRPRKFDDAIVLGAIEDVFWWSGLRATSVDELVEATGLYKPSLYGAFGDKRQMFLQALENYLSSARPKLNEALALQPISEAIRTLFDNSIATFTAGGSQARGCFMLSNAVPLAYDDPEIAAIVANAMDGFDRAVVERLKQAKAAGELREDADPELLAQVVGGTQCALAMRARAGFPADRLREMAENAVRLIDDYSACSRS